MPPAHLLRQVLERAPDYAAAKTMLSETRLAVPAIFILSGVAPGEGCIIERTEDAAGHPHAGGGRGLRRQSLRVEAGTETGLGWRARPIDSLGRAACARQLRAEDFASPFGWFRPPIANAHSRLAFNANAATGALALIGTEGTEPVTQVFRLA